MKNFRSRLFIGVTATSLLMALIIAGLLARSYFYDDEYRYLDQQSGRFIDILTLYGGLQMAKVENIYNRNGEWGWTWQPGWHCWPSSPFRKNWQVFEN